MKKLQNLRSLILVFIGTSIMSVAPIASAATASISSGDGIKISPVRTDISVDPGTTQTVSIVVQNVTSLSTTYQAIINDFVVKNGNETGQPDLILDPTQYAPSHSLKRFVAPISDVTVGPNQQTTVKVNINVPKTATGGGYYGAVRFAPTGAATGKNVTLSASVGTLILVKVPGNIKEQLAINSFDVRTSASADTGSSFFTGNKNLNAVVRFQNTGDLQEQPFGKILLKKGNTTLQTVEINNTDPRGNVLPGTIRRFSVPLNKVGSFGKYTIQGNFGYGSNGQLLSASSTFYVVPVPVIITSIVILLVIIALIVGLPKLIKSYNNKVLRRAGRR